jgi:methionyl-tRNA formyltransferase
MLDRIILLTGPVEQPVLGSILQGHNPVLTIRPAATLADVTALEPELLGRARLVAFCTDVVVPPEVLDRLGFGAYNFHPGPPRFPGWGCAHFAIHQGAAEFGATAHVMIEKVDAGPIVGIESFLIPPQATVSSLEGLAYAYLAQLFRRLAHALAVRTKPLPRLPIRWSGEKCTRHRYAAISAPPSDAAFLAPLAGRGPQAP